MVQLKFGITSYMLLLTCIAQGIVIIYQQHQLNTKTYLEIPPIKYMTSGEDSREMPSPHAEPETPLRDTHS